MAENPKIDFFRFELKSKNRSEKTFRDFVIDEINNDDELTNNDSFKENFGHFIKKIDLEHSKSKRLRKTITIISNPKTNPFHSKRPSPYINENYFSGVINGGPFDRDAIVSDVLDKKNNSKLGKNKSILLPYYIFVYLPSDHSEGFFAIHSNSQEETITQMFKKYIGDMFSGQNYFRPKFTPFVPKVFQNEFKSGAIIKNLAFNTTIIDNSVISNSIMINPNEYDVKIEVTPKKSSTNIDDADKLLNYFKNKVFNFGKKKNLTLEKFKTKKMTAKNPQTKKEKVFEWNTRDRDFRPTVYLENRVKIYNGIPEFNDLNDYCISLFEKTIIKELRPDLDAVKIN